MPLLKGLTGDVTVIVGGQALAFVAYGSAIAAEVTETYAALGRRMAVLTDPTEPDSVAIVSQPAVGRAIPRQDARIGVDLLDHDPDGDIVVVYDRTKAGVTQRVTATITVAPASAGNGWGKGEFYLPEIDPLTNRVIVEPAQASWDIYIAQDGLSASDIAALEIGHTNVPAASVNGAWILANPAQGGSDHYGTTEALAISQTLGLSTFAAYQSTENENSARMFFERGGVYGSNGDLVKFKRGFSALHPIFIGAWGTGDKPVSAAPGGPTVNSNGRPCNIVLQDVATPGDIAMSDGFCNVAIDGLSHYRDEANMLTGHATINDGGPMQFGLTVRGTTAFDCYKASPANTNWAIGNNQADRTSGFYSAFTVNALYQDVIIDQVGWGPGARADGDASAPQPPTQFSHAFYMQTLMNFLTLDTVAVSRGAFHGIQARAGLIGQDIVVMDCQAQLLIGGGPVEATREVSNYSMIDNYLGTVAATTTGWEGGAPRDLGDIVAEGIRVRFDPHVAVDRCVIINALEGRPELNLLTSGTSVMPCSRHAEGATAGLWNPIEAAVGGGYLDTNGMQLANWGPAASLNVEGISQGVLDGTTAGAFHDVLTGGSGGSHIDLINRWRAMANPFPEIRQFIDWARARLGAAITTRSVAATCVYQPDPLGKSPGNQAMIRRDWSTGDLPGTVPGDSVDLDGHVIGWNITPRNPLDDFTFGAGGGLRVTAGILDPQGTIVTDAGGHDVLIKNAGKFYVPGYDSANRLSVDALQARFMNRGTVTGGIDLTARYRSEVLLGYDNASFTLSAGRSLTIMGKSLVGFDGAAGGTSTLILAAGSTLHFRPSVRLTMTGLTAPNGRMVLPNIGSTVSNGSGATGIVMDWQYRLGTGAVFTVQMVTGAFAPPDALTCDDCHFEFNYRYGPAGVGTISAIGTVDLGRIAKFRSGLNGTAAPDVIAPVVLGGTLAPDVTALADGSYPLIDVDDVDGRFDDVVPAGNAGRTIEVNRTATTVTMVLGTGSTAVANNT